MSKENKHDSEVSFTKCPSCGVKLLSFMTAKDWFMCDNCGAYWEREKKGEEETKEKERVRA